jgi:signal transduction histidine kinase
VNEVVAVIAKELDDRFPGKQIEIQYAALPTVAMGREQATLLFRELINNAVIFNESSFIKLLIDSPSPETVSPAPAASEIAIRIQDNGIGIPPDQTDRIFLPFVRLNGKSTYPGTGLGLAICRRIVKSYAGIIYAASGTPQGTAITLILPQILN